MAPKKKIISFRLPPDLIAVLGKKASKQHVSRNKLTELILRDHFAQGDKHLGALVEREAARSDKAASIFA